MSQVEVAQDAQMVLRRALSMFPTGVVALCAQVDGEPVGMAANSFTSVSLDPPLVAVCVDKGSRTWPRLAQSERVGISVLGTQHKAECRQLAQRQGDRFAGIDWSVTPQQAVFIDDAALWLECTVRAVFEGGDHEVVLFEVHDAQAFPEVKPLVFHQSQFRELISDD
ncbi:flavin reductase family protein [Jonesiaceae bacterium BS-20]|uniref:Flavin reductase family protein n=1 Tax=Jonesiaceae bacterium BS-20 TaxID=3120821 RepID=A0AAU7DUR9_9MICO